MQQQDCNHCIQQSLFHHCCATFTAVHHSFTHWAAWPRCCSGVQVFD